MDIGVAREIKKHEYRVGMTPMGAREYVEAGHKLFIEKAAGTGAGFEDKEYKAAGATIMENKKELFKRCQMIVKVKEPLPEEYPLFHKGQILYTYLHLAAAKELTKFLMDAKIDSVAYETIELDDRTLPCLAPMSEIAGRLSIQEGAKYLEKPFGGRGILLGGVPGIRRGKVAVLGGGTVGINACKMAVGLGADVTVLDVNGKRLGYLDDIFGTSLTTLYSNRHNIEEVLKEADVVIGAVLIPGGRAPWLVTRDDLKKMKKGAVIVDVAIDQGGCFETSKATTHDDPVYIVDGIVHYCVANMPGVVALSSTIALTTQTQIYGLMIANLGLKKAVRECKPLKRGVNIFGGKCVYKNLADSLGLKFADIDKML